MEPISIIAIGLVALYLLKDKKKEEEKKLEDLYLLEAEEELQASKFSIPKAVAPDLHIKANVEVSSIADTLWNVRVTWTIKNNSKTDYYIRDVKSTLNLANYKVDNWVPGNRDNMLLKAGSTISVVSSVNDKKLWVKNASVICKNVRDAIKAINTDQPGGAKKLNQLVYIDSTAYTITTPYADATNEVQIVEPIECTLEYKDTVKVYAKRGSNALDWKEDEERK